MSKRWWWAVLVTIGFGVVYSWKLGTSFNVDSDWARDIHDVIKITQGDISLIGPPLSAGAFAGPYYYYFLVPVFRITGLNETAMVMFNAWVFAVALGVVMYVIYGRWGAKSWLAVSAWGLSPAWINAARHPGNAYSYLPLLVLSWVMVYFKQRWRAWEALALGILLGIIANYHPGALFAIIPVVIFLLVKKMGWRQRWWWAVGMAGTLAPLVLFEMKNQFVITKGIFIYKKFAAFTGGVPTIYLTLAKKNLWENMWFISDRMQKLLGINPIAYLVSGLIIVGRKRTWMVAAGTGWVLTIIGVRHIFEYHYLLPAAGLILTAWILGVAKNRFATVILAGVIAIELVSFPGQLYQLATRPASQFEKTVNTAVKRGWVNSQDSFNVIGIMEENHYVVSGNEYRFYLRKNGFKPLPVYDYQNADELLIFSEVKDLNIEKLDMWETEQFGKSNLREFEKTKIESITAYRIKKLT